MPLLDVTDNLLDPDFITTISVSRTSTSVQEGMTQLGTPVVTDGVNASVQPATSNDIARMPDGEYLTGSIVIYTTFQLIASAPGYTADVVAWNGRSYTVMSVDDWSQFGAGYVRGLARMLSVR